MQRHICLEIDQFCLLLVHLTTQSKPASRSPSKIIQKKYKKRANSAPPCRRSHSGPLSLLLRLLIFSPNQCQLNSNVLCIWSKFTSFAQHLYYSSTWMWMLRLYLCSPPQPAPQRGRHLDWSVSGSSPSTSPSSPGSVC